MVQGLPPDVIKSPRLIFYSENKGKILSLIYIPLVCYYTLRFVAVKSRSSPEGKGERAFNLIRLIVYIINYNFIYKLGFGKIVLHNLLKNGNTVPYVNIQRACINVNSWVKFLRV